MKRYNVYWCESIIECSDGEFVEYNEVKQLEEEKNNLLEGLEKLGCPVQLKDLPEYFKNLTKTIQLLQEKITTLEKK